MYRESECFAGAVLCALQAGPFVVVTLGLNLRQSGDCACMVETHLLSSRRDVAPTFEDVYLTAQASIQMRVVFETSARPVQNPLVAYVLFAALARDFRGLLC